MPKRIELMWIHLWASYILSLIEYMSMNIWWKEQILLQIILKKSLYQETKLQKTVDPATTYSMTKSVWIYMCLMKKKRHNKREPHIQQKEHRVVGRNTIPWASSLRPLATNWERVSNSHCQRCAVTGDLLAWSALPRVGRLSGYLEFGTDPIWVMFMGWTERAGPG